MAAAFKGSLSSSLSLFDEPLREILRGLCVIGNENGNSCGHNGQDETLTTTEAEAKQKVNLLKAGDNGDKSGMSCAMCKVDFHSVEIQREHFKLDWHKFNLKQKLMGKTVLSEDAFEETISGELSSISGSDSDTDSDLTLESIQRSKCQPEETSVTKNRLTGRQYPKVLFVNEDGDVLSVYRSVLCSVKNVPTSFDTMVSLLANLPKFSYWIILMTAGGHFAGAVFNGKEILTHKTFHRYTVRAKRGTAQGARDAQQGGNQPKSAGASLRRHNEAALLQEVQDLLEAWSQHVEQCHRIFIRTPAYNKSMFFGGKKPPFRKDDERIRTIPFATRRPTFKEVKRVHEELSSVLLLGKESDEEIQGILKRFTQSERAKGLSSVEEDSTATSQEDQNTDAKIEEEEEADLQGNEDKREEEMAPVTRPQGTPKKNKKKKTKNKKGNELELFGDKVSPEQHLWNRLYCAVVSGNKEIIASVVGNDDRGPENDNFEHKGDCLLAKANPDVNCKDGEISNDKKIAKPSENGKIINRTDADQICGCDIVSSSDSLNLDNGLYGNEVSSSNGRSECNGELSSVNILEVINGRFGEVGDTLLHVAARFSQTQIVLMLLENGADPAVKDMKGRPPFAVAGDKETRNEFRRFMASYPDRYDYAKAQIPSALTPEMEIEKEKRIAERKKAQKKAQRQRAKEQKAVERRKEEEEKEKRTFEALSEREKRALAAEKRFAQQLASKQNGTISCAWCCSSLDCLVPFERLIYKYCSTACVRAHRVDMESQNDR